MSKDLIKLAVIGIAAGTCISGQFAPLKVKPDLASANASAVGDGQKEMQGSGQGQQCRASGYCNGKNGCGGQSGSSKDKNKSTPNTPDQKGQMKENADKQIKRTGMQSNNERPKRKSAAARVVEGR